MLWNHTTQGHVIYICYIETYYNITVYLYMISVCDNSLWWNWDNTRIMIFFKKEKWYLMIMQTAKLLFVLVFFFFWKLFLQCLFIFFLIIAYHLWMWMNLMCGLKNKFTWRMYSIFAHCSWKYIRCLGLV